MAIVNQLPSGVGVDIGNLTQIHWGSIASNQTYTFNENYENVMCIMAVGGTGINNFYLQSSKEPIHEIKQTGNGSVSMDILYFDKVGVGDTLKVIATRGYGQIMIFTIE